MAQRAWAHRFKKAHSLRITVTAYLIPIIGQYSRWRAVAGSGVLNWGFSKASPQLASSKCGIGQLVPSPRDGKRPLQEGFEAWGEDLVAGIDGILGIAAATAPIQVAHHQKRKDRASTAQSRKPAVRGYRDRTRDFCSRNHNRFHHAFPASKRFRTNSP